LESCRVLLDGFKVFFVDFEELLKGIHESSYWDCTDKKSKLD
jgi:hypothetical protein